MFSDINFKPLTSANVRHLGFSRILLIRRCISALKRMNYYFVLQKCQTRKDNMLIYIFFFCWSIDVFLTYKLWICLLWLECFNCTKTDQWCYSVRYYDLTLRFNSFSAKYFRRLKIRLLRSSDDRSVLAYFNNLKAFFIKPGY